MAQASIYWDMQNYAAIEKIFRKSFEFCSDHDTWRLNVGHVLFMQESSKYKKAIDFYAPIVKKHYDNVRTKLMSRKIIYSSLICICFMRLDFECESDCTGQSVRHLCHVQPK